MLLVGVGVRIVLFSCEIYTVIFTLLVYPVSDAVPYSLPGDAAWGWTGFVCLVKAFCKEIGCFDWFLLPQLLHCYLCPKFKTSLKSTSTLGFNSLAVLLGASEILPPQADYGNGLSTRARCLR